MKKFYFTLFLSALFLLPSFSNAADLGDNPFKNLMFNDVFLNHENFDAIYFLYNAGIIEGYEIEDSALREYHPENNINRAEFLTLLILGSNVDDGGEYDSCFGDVPDDEWYTNFVCQAKEMGWVDGYPDGAFRPAQSINEAESLKIMGEVLNWTLNETELGDEWFIPYLDYANGKNIIENENAGEFIDRGDMAEMIFRDTQISTLDIPLYDENKDEELFDYYDIPIFGPLGPGGFFGPGGAFGDGGAFIPGGAFVNDDGSFDVLTDEYFDQMYCYYSPDGEFVVEVWDILENYTDKEIDQLFIENADTDGFGKVLCYDGIPATDLTELTAELRSEYEITCWNSPGESADYQGYDELLCYTEPAEQSVPDESPVIISPEVEVSEVEISVYGATVGDDIAIQFQLIDQNGSPISGRSDEILAYITSGIDYYEELSVSEGIFGLYGASFSSISKGDYFVTVRDTVSGEESYADFTLEPLSLDHVEIIDVLDPSESGSVDTAYLKVVSRDKFGNVLPYSTVNNKLSAVSSLGSVTEVSHDNDGVFTMEITSNEWGVSDVMIIEQGTGVSFIESANIFFWPVQLDMPKGIPEGTEQISVDLNLFFPESEGYLGAYDITLAYDPNSITFLDIEDGVLNDNFSTANVEVFEEEGEIHIWQETDAPLESTEMMRVGSLLFNVTSTLDGTIIVQDAVLKNEEGAARGYVERFSDWVGGLSDPFWRWYYDIKRNVDICVDAFIFPGSTVTAAGITTDLNAVNRIFAAAANNCNCDFFLTVILGTVFNMTAAQWAAIDNNPTNSQLDAAEVNTMLTNHPATNNCVPVYYTQNIYGPPTGGQAIGRSFRSPPRTGNGVAIDDDIDGDDRTLAHELVHQLSHNEVVDPSNPPDSATQGADTPGNIMNYNATGDNMTGSQCDLVEQYLP